MDIELDQKYDRIKHWIPDVIIDLKYSTSDNFVGRPVYDKLYDELRIGTLKKLKIAADLLREKGFRLVIWDAYRPIAVQHVLWDIIGNSDYVAHPSTGSKHNRGCAVDLTLANIMGVELEMPSLFDDFSELASAVRINENQEINLWIMKLQTAMKQAGFEIYEKEWWHFSDEQWMNYEIS